MLGFLRNGKLSIRTQPVKRLNVKYATTAGKVDVKLDDDANANKIISPEEKPTKPVAPNFINRLFYGTFDKSIFVYPVAKCESLDVLKALGAEVQNVIQVVGHSKEVTLKVVAELKRLKLFGLSIPREYGGLDHSQAETSYIEEIVNDNFKIGHLLAYQNNFVSKILTLLGSEKQKQKYLPKLASGDCFGCLAYLEKSAILDFQSMETITTFYDAKKHYILNGTKRFVCNADIADIIIVLSRGSTFDSSKMNISSFYHFCLIDKNAQGVEIHKLNNSNNEEYISLYDINFNNVAIHEENVVGKFDNSAYFALKTILSYNQLSASVACLSVLKCLLHSAILKCDKLTLNDLPLKNFSFIKNNITCLYQWTYAVESMVYLAAARLDEYKGSDLLLETCATKLMAIEYLKLAIEKYVEILGNQSYISPGLVEKAIKTLNYYSTMDDTQTHLKLLIGSHGLLTAAQMSETLRENVKALRKPFYNPYTFFRIFISPRSVRLKELIKSPSLKMEVHPYLSEEANNLEECFATLNLIVEKQYKYGGYKATEDEIRVMDFGEIAANIYALTACISRASTSYCHYANNAHDEINIVRLLSKDVKIKVEDWAARITKLEDYLNYYMYVGDSCFKNKQYPLQHPLARTV